MFALYLVLSSLHGHLAAMPCQNVLFRIYSFVIIVIAADAQSLALKTRGWTYVSASSQRS